MSNIGRFIIGMFVSLLVAASIAILSWGAVLDGRDVQERLRVVRDAGAAWTAEPSVHTSPIERNSPR